MSYITCLLYLKGKLTCYIILGIAKLKTILNLLILIIISAS
jgi:hypothetical protein